MSCFPRTSMKSYKWWRGFSFLCSTRLKNSAMPLRKLGRADAMALSRAEKKGKRERHDVFRASMKPRKHAILLSDRNRSARILHRTDELSMFVVKSSGNKGENNKRVLSFAIESAKGFDPRQPRIFLFSIWKSWSSVSIVREHALSLKSLMLIWVCSQNAVWLYVKYVCIEVRSIPNPCSSTLDIYVIDTW